MILVDANLILYAEDRLSKHHAAAREWWDEQLSGTEAVCLCWPVITAFLRITTNPRIMSHPFSGEQAVARVNRWLRQPCVRLIRETEGHWQILAALMDEAEATANLIPDAHLAALAVGHNCTLCSSDLDFARFRTLRWRNPLK
ncbi:MAG: type II toxin-antitoxin system VapC family toxin [Planctomycetota bacterium]